MKKPNLIDEHEVFKINKNCKVEIIDISTSGEKCVIIDDVYENPELVRDVILTTPPTRNQKVRFAMEGYRNSTQLDLFQLGELLHNVATKTFDFAKDWSLNSVNTCLSNMMFQSNIMRWQDQLENVRESIGTPHMDGNKMDVVSGFGGDFMRCQSNGLAGLVYMNTPEECSGGTGFYSFDGKFTNGSISEPNSTRISVDSEDFSKQWVNDSVGDWKLEELIDMKYNRMIIYPFWIYHSAYLTENDTFDGDPVYRINQVLFP